MSSSTVGSSGSSHDDAAPNLSRPKSGRTTLRIVSISLILRYIRSSLNQSGLTSSSFGSVGREDQDPRNTSCPFSTPSDTPERADPSYHATRIPRHLRACPTPRDPPQIFPGGARSFSAVAYDVLTAGTPLLDTDSSLAKAERKRLHDNSERMRGVYFMHCQLAPSHSCCTSLPWGPGSFQPDRKRHQRCASVQFELHTISRPHLSILHWRFSTCLCNNDKTYTPFKHTAPRRREKFRQ
ncbi:hypothetical protein IWX49DRAFT_240846 [Phyllosticta citricarpa]|uniref:Uncharacterized protein n=1 Tax=Phyllosticta citricarpa TaxID=55181 RepID=A0ABR1MIB5_9PEZI